MYEAHKTTNKTTDTRGKDMQDWLFTKIGSCINIRNNKGAIDALAKKTLAKEENK